MARVLKYPRVRSVAVYECLPQSNGCGAVMEFETSDINEPTSAGSDTRFVRCVCGLEVPAQDLTWKERGPDVV